MRTQKILDKIAAIGEGGMITEENRFDQEFLLTVLNSFRAQYLRDTYLKTKRINPICYQKFHPVYEPTFQNSGACYAKFKVPNTIQLDVHSDGLRYFGTDPVTAGCSKNFRRVTSRAWLSTFNNHQVTSSSSTRFISYLYDGALETAEIYGKGKFMIFPPLIEGLFSDPTSVPMFNFDISEYPLNIDALPMIEQMIFAANTRFVESTAPTPAFATQQIAKK